jgi:hypothetical protein
MSLIPCRDCGNMIDPNSRGCPTCAMNLDAERMIYKIVFYGLLVGGILTVGLIVILYLRH